MRRASCLAMVGVATLVGAGGRRVTAQTAPAKDGKVDAWVITAHTKARMGSNAADPEGPLMSSLVKITRVGDIERIEAGLNPNAGQWEMGSSGPPGMAFLTAVTDTNVVVTVLDSSQKVYTTPNVHEVPTPPPGAPPIPKEMIPVIKVSDLSVTVDSLGPGPEVLGHPTMRYRQTQKATVQSDVGTMTTIVRTQSSADITIATGIPNAPRVTGFGIERLVDGGEGITLSQDYLAAMRTATAKYPRGIVVHVEGVYKTPMGGVRTVKLDVDKIEQTRVDAALFTPPADYTKNQMGVPGLPFGFFSGPYGMPY